MKNNNLPISRGKDAEELLAKVFKEAGWRVQHRRPRHNADADLIVKHRNATYLIQVKTANEGRPDRLIPLWSQAYIEAMHEAADNHAPLAIVAAPRIAPAAAERVIKFAAEYAPDAAVGVMDLEGLRVFRGPHLANLDSEGTRTHSDVSPIQSESRGLFSDLNQWMLKVLLAPEIPDKLLSAPRGRYKNASQLARAANVSVMHAFRLVQQLEQEHFLHESKSSLTLVRREALFHRWQSHSHRPIPEVRARFALRGNQEKELRRITKSGRACLALFAAADAMHLGFVHGVPPYVYLQRLRPGNLATWKNVVVAESEQAPDLILRKAPAPQSIFRGLVRFDDLPVTDVIQTWLDVSSHLSRGQEQADLIRKRVLEPIIGG